MGRIFSRSSCSLHTESNQYAVQNQPNPKNYRIEKIEQVEDNCVVKIIYPDCTNYEGRKILVFKDCLIEDIQKLDVIDPHFCRGEHLSPFARFEPTIVGWLSAIKLCEHL